ncbi:ROK family transcriptional regulator [Alicyclobacillaceae bacterium I2511]|nr:ROK family transcriptional regulator [Alicyclobacillaceae bacterium I2511]
MKLEKGTLAGIRNTNRINILEIVKEHEPVSRAKIAKVLRMSRSNISDIVESLIDEGLLREEGTGESTSQGGRKPVHLRFVANAKYALGIDIGGTKTIALLADLKGNVVQRLKFSSHREGLGALENIRNEITKFLVESNVQQEKIVATGIGVPAITDYKTGEIISAPGLFQEQINVRNFFKEQLPNPIFVDNDVNMGVIGECWRGNGTGFSNVTLLAIGTGIGAGIVINGQVYRGATGFAGEIGYLQVNPLEDKTIEVSHFGPLETMASGRGIEKLIPTFLDRYPDTVLTCTTTAEGIFAAMRNGDELAQDLVDNMVKYLAFAISNIISILNPQRIIIGGGVAQAGEDFLHRIESRVHKLIPVDFELVPAGLGEDASAYGAAATALLATGNMQLFSS